MHNKTVTLLLATLLISVSMASSLNSQPALNVNTQQGIMQRLQALEAQHNLILEGQKKQLEALEVLKQNARQTKIFASRG